MAELLKTSTATIAETLAGFDKLAPLDKPVLLDKPVPFDLLRDAVRAAWLRAEQPTKAILAAKTGLAEEQVHTVLRSRIVAPWEDTERVLRCMGMHDDARLARLRLLHDLAAAPDQQAARAFLLDLTARPPSEVLRDRGPRANQEIRRLTLLLEETRPPEIDLSGITADAQLLEKLRELKAAAGMSLRDIERSMRALDRRNAVGKTTIGKYLAQNATALPRSQSAEQVTLLFKVLLLGAAPPDKEVARRQLEDYFLCWQRLITIPPGTDPVPGTTTTPAEPDLTLVQAAELFVDHEAELLKLAAAGTWSTSRHYRMLAVVMLLCCVGSIAVGFLIVRMFG